jgi:methylated-DNA-[protein]-cysteine S-methyltransferase
MKHFAHADGPLGRMLLVADGDALCGLYFEGQKYERQPGIDWLEAPDRPVLAAARHQLSEYFAEERKQFDLPLSLEGTDFQRRVWAALTRIPAGETVSYGDIARTIGAADIGRNPLSIVVPCHRVIGSKGALTGYAGGLERKRALLALEARARAFVLS